MREPMQPLVMVDDVIRFQENVIVRRLLDEGGIDLNQMQTWFDVPQKDWEQFYQLIGYSLSGFHELSKVSDRTAQRATIRARQQFGPEVGGCRDSGCPIHTKEL